MSIRPITEDDLHAFIDDRLDAARRSEVGAYLEAHPDVARRVSDYRAQSSLLEAALGPVAEEPIPPELDLSHMVENRQRQHPPRRWMLAAAAVALVCAGLAGGWTLRGYTLPASRGIDALAQEATASYAVYAPDRFRPVEIRAEDRGALVAWTREQLGRAIEIPNLAASGYRLMGGRVVPTDHGAAALFMYDDDKGSRLVMFVRPMAIDKDMPMSLHARGDVNGYAWADGGLGYSLTGSVPPARLQPMADDARRQLQVAG